MFDVAVLVESTARGAAVACRGQDSRSFTAISLVHCCLGQDEIRKADRLVHQSCLGKILEMISTF